MSFGPRGAKFTVGPRGRRTSLGIPGTGLFYTTTGSQSVSKTDVPAGAEPATPVVPPESKLTMGFFKRLVTPDEEEAFVDGCRELLLGHETKALEHLENAIHLPDAAYLAGFLALKRDRLNQAVERLVTAAGNKSRLGRHFSKYGISALISVRITNEVFAHVGPSLRGVLLLLVEAYQRLGHIREALACLEHLRRLEPGDVVVKLSLAELLMESRDKHRSKKQFEQTCRKVVRLGEGVENDSTVHAALMFYKARALRELGLLEAARNTLTAAFRRKKDRPPELLRAIRYERALIYQEMGKKKRATQEFGKIYAEAPDYEDVAERLGFG